MYVNNSFKSFFNNIIISIFTLAFFSLSCENGLIPYKFEQEKIDSCVVWGPNPIILDHDVEVTSAGTLQILPGTIIRLVEGSVIVPDPAGDLLRTPRIIVKGTLICKGKKGTMIRFEGAESHDPECAQIRIFTDSSHKSIISWSRMGYLRWQHGSCHVSHSVIGKANIEYCKEMEITSNSFGGLFVLDGDGIIEKNQITGSPFQIGGLGNIGGSLIIKRNYIHDISGEGESLPKSPGIWCSHGSHSQIIENTIDNCDEAIFIFSATPEIHRNNIINNKINILVMPFTDNPQYDTVDATNNWWGTTNKAEIMDKIVFSSNGGTVSGKVIKFEPIAKQPFNWQEIK